MLSPRATKALSILKDGGYFRTQLETTYRGRQQFVTRLRDASGSVAKGFGGKTMHELKDAGLLQWRETRGSSSWPTEYVAA